jgi:F-type H+-transporting ATPase subunit epsilon
MRLEIVTPNGRVLDAEAKSVTAPGYLGEFGILPGHQAALVMLSGGALRYEDASGEQIVLIRGGIAQISDDSVLVLADETVAVDDIDRTRAEAILDAAVKGINEVEYLDDSELHRLSADRAYGEALIQRAGH